MAIARGTAPVFRVGVANVTIGSGFIVSTGADLDYTAKTEEFPDADGETVGMLFYDRRRSLSLAVYPAGTSAANANSANDFTITTSGQSLQPGKAITLTASTDNDLNGGWVIMDAKKNRRTDGRCTFTLSLVAPDTHRANLVANEFTV